MNKTDPASKYTIGEVAKIADISTDTLRFYERKGLVTPESKTPAGYRIYNDMNVRVTKFIKEAQAHGLGLSDIKEILDMRDADFGSCASVLHMMIAKKHKMEMKLIAMTSILHGIEEWIEACNVGGELPVKDCPILKSLNDPLLNSPDNHG